MGGRLILHIGLSKTGSSAIQTTLVRNARKLEAHGIHYPQSVNSEDARRGIATTGNAGDLVPLLRPRRRPEGFDERAAIETVKRQCAQTQGAVLYSSEALGFAEKGKTASFCREMTEAGIEVSVVVFVRHVVDHAFKAYLQGFRDDAPKDGVYRFSDFLRRYPGWKRWLSTWATPLGDAALNVSLYDAAKANLIPRFLELCGCPDIDLEESGEVNASLTARQGQMLTALMEAEPTAPPLAAVKIAIAAGKHEIDRSAPITISREDANFVREKFEGELAEITERFALEAPLKCWSDGVVIVEGEAPALERDTQLFLAECARQLAEYEERVQDLKHRNQNLKSQRDAMANASEKTE